MKKKKENFGPNILPLALMSLKRLEGKKNVLKYFFEKLENCMNKMGLETSDFLVSYLSGIVPSEIRGNISAVSIWFFR